MWNKRIGLSIEQGLLCVLRGTNVTGSATRLPSAHFLVIRLANTITPPHLFPVKHNIYTAVFSVIPVRSSCLRALRLA